MRYLFLLVLLYAPCILPAQPGSAPPVKYTRSSLLIKEAFLRPLDTARWKTELQPSSGSVVKAGGGKLLMQTGAGVTVWLNQLLQGNFVITYTCTVVMNGGPFDRLSDLNQFWMALDPRSADLFTRGGKLESYDSLQLYYVGMGGNTNTTTRFRRYNGKGDRVLLAEYTDQPHLLIPNHPYRIKTVVYKGVTEYWVDDQIFFSCKDPAPFTRGYFGFRSTKSNHEVKDFAVYRIK